MTAYTPIPAPPTGATADVVAAAPSGDTTGVTDGASLRAIVAAASAGSMIVLGGGTFVIDEPLVVGSGVSIVGAGMYGTIIKAADGSDMDGVIVAEEWSAGNDSSDAPLTIRDLCIDANRANNAGLGHGIILQSYWSTIENVAVRNCDGSGILVTAEESDSSEITNTLVETHISRCQIRDVTGHGIWVRDDSPSTQSVTDGRIESCDIQNISGNGINIDSAAGWKVRGNHLYSVAKTAIHLNRPWHTTVSDNYSESWGTSTDDGTYAFINADAAIGPVAIIGNHAYNTGTIDSGTTLRGILITGSTSVTTTAVVTGNVLIGKTAATATNGLRVATSGASAVVVLVEHTNSFSGFDLQKAYSANGGTITRVHKQFAYQSTPTDVVRENVPGRETGLANVGPLSSGRLHMELVWYDAGEVVTSITWATNTTSGSGLTNRWSALFDINRNQLAISADDTSATWSGEQTFTMTAAYTIPTSGFYYHGLCVVGSTVPTLRGFATLAGATDEVPIAAGSSSTGLTNPASCPSTAGAITAVNTRSWTASK